MIFIFTGVISSVLLHFLIVENVIHAQRNPAYIFTICRFSHLAIGAYAAFMLFHQESYQKVLKLVRNKILQAVVISFTVLLSFNIIHLPAFVDDYFLDTIPAILFGYIILSAVTGNFIFNLEISWLKLLGKYS